jgi:hypothetical protein
MYLISSRIQWDGLVAWGLDEVLTSPHRQGMVHRASEWVGCCEYGNEKSGSKNGDEFLDWLSDC